MSEESSIREDRRYTKDHEWARVDGDDVIVGITSFAVEQLGDVTLVNIDVAKGDQVKAGQVFGTIESVKTLSDLYAPISGTVERINTELESSPERVNEDCWSAGWMVAIKPDNAGDVAELLDAASYRAHVASLAH